MSTFDQHSEIAQDLEPMDSGYCIWEQELLLLKPSKSLLAVEMTIH